MTCTFRQALVLAALVAAACAGERELIPAPNALVVAGEPSRAVERVAGVTVSADPKTWDGYPRNLEQDLTPIHVTIRNGSGRPVLVRYDELSLRGQSGSVYPALPPMRIDRAGPIQNAIVPLYAPERFWVAPYLGPYYPHLQPWDGPFPPIDPVLYARTRWRPELPTADMLRRALPEGVLADGGTVQGYVYFDHVADRERTVVFRAALAEGHDSKRVASVAIPFVIR